MCVKFDNLLTSNKFLPVVIQGFQRETKVKKNRPFLLYSGFRSYEVQS